MKFFILTLFCILSATTFAQKQYKFQMQCGEKTHQVDTFTCMRLYVMHHRSKTDSVMRKLEGYLRYVTKDSISMMVYEYRDLEESSHTHNIYYPQILIMNFKLSEIYKLNIENDNASFTAVMTFFTSLLTGLVVSPLVSLDEGKMNWSKVKIISLSSLGVAVSSIFFISTIYLHHPMKMMKRKDRLWLIKLPE
jgi:hypothetical protein